VTGLLLPDSFQLPLGQLLATLLLLVVLPLATGRLWARVTTRPGSSPSLHRRGLALAARLSDVALLVAIGAALLFDPAALLEVWTGPIMFIAGATMLVVFLAARILSSDGARQRTLIVVMNARAVALGLTLVALYLPDLPEVRTVVLGFGGIMQLVPIGVAVSVRLGHRRR
jgi:predicted Na+-dependent transporter